ncbi:hypothetical protein ACHAWF_012668 [Thalassiosira exigua]
MASFRSSASLAPPRPTSSASVLSTTRSLPSSSGVESHPAEGKYYCREYGLGPRRDVRFATRGSSEGNRHAEVAFKTASGDAPISGLEFSGDGALLVAGGPRVGIYGGRGRTPGTSDLERALRAGSAAQRKWAERGEGDEDDGSVDLFGGKFKDVRKGAGGGGGGGGGLDDVSADRNVNTGGLLAFAVAPRSDGRLLAIGAEGGAVKICNAHSRATLRTFHSSKREGGGDRKAIRGAAWMRDGKRVVAGGDDGLVRVWSVSGGMRDGGLGDRDGPDVALRGHGDRVSCVAAVPFRRDDAPGGGRGGKARGAKRSRADGARSSDLYDDDEASEWRELVVSGSYDRTVRIWDVDSEAAPGEDRCVSILDHGDPVQALLVLPPRRDGGGASGKVAKSKAARRLDGVPLLVSAGGTTLKVWNPLNGSCVGTFPTKHAKTVTSLCLLDVADETGDDEEGVGRRRHVLTGGLDGLIRVHSASTEDLAAGSLPYLHGLQLGEPVSALALSKDGSRLAVGTTSGTVRVHRRRPPPRLAVDDEGARPEPRHGTYSYFRRGAHEPSRDPDDYLLAHQKKKRLAEYDVLLRKFRYGDALDAALAKRQPQAVVAVVEELGRRRGLTIALSNRDEDSLDAVLSFCVRFVDDPRYAAHLAGVAHILCDVYGHLGGQSAAVDELFRRLREKVANECAVQKMLLRMLGQIDYVVTKAEMMDEEERGRQRG